MSPSELIGLKIDEIRYTYQIDDGLQIFYAYLKLSNGCIIDMPHYPDLDAQTSQSRLQKISIHFINAKKPIKQCKQQIEGQKIVDIHYCYYEDEPDEQRRAYMELGNGKFITEVNYGPIGLPGIDLSILSKKQFETNKSELEEGFSIKSYLTELRNFLD